MVCVENIPFSLIKPKKNKKKVYNKLERYNRKKRVREHILLFLKKKYIIDIIYNGVCPACGESNTKDHLPL